ncbi:MAG: hypothetical protein KJ558_08180 [Gammaproteobacteria bacterium]|nr:hypothetical protein [Gammaproteobacteria bacterium]MBU1654790.1 hypothetical protein [Gammaproteobacteria bacterium]MBU1961441.1 hypothetical protein [Gammaproteobacteria bacterium]
MSHLLALLGFAALLGSWVAFQIWLKKVNPGREFQPGCGACKNGSCSKRQ